MRYSEEGMIEIMKKNGVDFTASLPCEKIKALLDIIGESFFHVPLTREEEGVGICAGAALSGKRPAIFVQSSGIGNMINALLSLTVFYELPLAIFISRRGVYKEKIAAQAPMGKRLPGVLKGAAIQHTAINTRDDFRLIEKKLPDVYEKNKKHTVHAFMLSPALWEEDVCERGSGLKCPVSERPVRSSEFKTADVTARFTRFEILKIIAPYLESRAVVCNLGFPSKELFSIKHQRSNFYMLGSMGMATAIGLGISLTSEKEVIVIDGDGSLLMNPGTLATAAHYAPDNLMILAVDNGSYGSTGGQPTLAGSCVDLELVAKGFGIRDTVKAATKEQIIRAIETPRKGLRFVHIPAVPGNQDVPDIPLHQLEIKEQVQEFLTGKA
jgi:sulfopyruvate decarboxylase beta subunit